MFATKRQKFHTDDVISMAKSEEKRMFSQGINDFKKLKLEPAARSCATGQQILFSDSCQLTITWTSIIKLNVGCRLPDKLKNVISHWLSLARMDGRSHIWLPKFLGCIDHKSFLPMVLPRESPAIIFTLAEREVKDSRRSGMYQSWLFWQDWACKVCRFSVLFGYLTKWGPN